MNQTIKIPVLPLAALAEISQEIDRENRAYWPSRAKAVSQRKPRKRTRLKLSKAQVALLNKECQSLADDEALLILFESVTRLQAGRYTDLFRQLCEGDRTVRHMQDSRFMGLWDFFTGKRGASPGIFSVLRDFLALVREAMAAISDAATALKAAPSEANLHAFLEAVEHYGAKIAAQARAYPSIFNWVDAMLNEEELGDYSPRSGSL